MDGLGSTLKNRYTKHSVRTRLEIFGVLCGGGRSFTLFVQIWEWFPDNNKEKKGDRTMLSKKEMLALAEEYSSWAENSRGFFLGLEKIS